MNLTIIALIISGLVLIFGGGSVFSSWKRNAVLEYRMDQADLAVKEHSKDLAALKSSLALTDQSLGQVVNKLHKLDLLETITGQMNLLMSRTENILPRQEADAKFGELGRRVDHVEEAVQTLEHK